MCVSLEYCALTPQDSVLDLKLSKRTTYITQAFWDSGITTIGMLMQCPDLLLLELPGIRRGAIQIVDDALYHHSSHETDLRRGPFHPISFLRLSPTLEAQLAKYETIAYLRHRLDQGDELTLTGTYSQNKVRDAVNWFYDSPFCKKL